MIVALHDLMNNHTNCSLQPIVLAVDFTWAELQTLKLTQRFAFRDQSYNGKHLPPSPFPKLHVSYGERLSFKKQFPVKVS